jgi:hypothetical protein
MYKKQSVNSITKVAKSIGELATAGTVVNSSNNSLNRLPIVREIDHYVLTSGLGLGSPFMIKSSAPGDNS